MFDRSVRSLLVLVMLASSDAVFAQSSAADPSLLAEILRIRAIDNHCHCDAADPTRGGNWKPDNPLGEPRYPDVVPLRRDNPQWVSAWKALYQYRYADMSPLHLAGVLETKRGMMRDAADGWPAYVLDRSGVDIALVNATQLGSGQSHARFRWVPYGDPLLWPFAGDKSELRFAGGNTSIALLEREINVSSTPPTLDAYASQVVEPTVQRWASAGAVAVKFLSAYQRSLDFLPTDASAAASVYMQGAAGRALDPSQRKTLEDYLFFEVARRAGAHGLVVHIHTGNGDGPYFDNSRANPGLLEPALNSKALRDTRFVLLHGGWPFHLTTQAMLDKPNTYADFSAQTFYLTTHALADVLRGWLEWHPEKVLFGSDAYSDENTPLSDYEEKQWLMTDKARRALAIALTGMMTDKEISRTRAVEIARMVLRDNAMTLYRLTP